MKQWQCIICGFIYDEAEGWPDDGIAPGTAWEDVPDDWTCPDCGVGKADFEMVELTDDEEPTTPSEPSSRPVVVDPAHAAATADRAPIVIIGSGYAGYGLAMSLRDRGCDADIHVFTADDGARYRKPNLSIGFALGKDDALLLDESAPDIERRLDIRVHAFCPVEHIDCEHQMVITSKGQLAYSRLILAPGASPVQLPIDDPEQAVLSINNRLDYRRLRNVLASAPNAARIVVIGDGLIGCEFANDLVQAGFEVDVVGLGDHPMPKLLPPLAGDKLKTALTHIGVNWYLGRSALSVRRTDSRYGVTLTDEQELIADVVISAVGLAPNIELARGADIACHRGIVVDDDLSTSQPNVYAIGDCIEVEGVVKPYLAPIDAGIEPLVRTLMGQRTPVSYPPTPIRVKTPVAPACIFPPPVGAQGRWLEQLDEDGVRAGFYADDGRLIGFALVGRHAVRKQSAWLKVCHSPASSCETSQTFHRQI